jgi:hypothetical protein
MAQIERFKARMKNASKATTEYRMTIAEAKGLLEEIVALQKSLEEKPKTVTVQAAEPVPEPITRIIDGGTF